MTITIKDVYKEGVEREIVRLFRELKKSDSTLQVMMYDADPNNKDEMERLESKLLALENFRARCFSLIGYINTIKTIEFLKDKEIGGD